MRKILTIVCMAVMISSCIKDDKGCQGVMPSQEEAQIKAYASTNGMTVSKHSSGLFYQILNQGSGPTPSLYSKVFITYTGSLIKNNVVFDSQTNPGLTGWTLSSLIEGWQIGLSLIQKGGHIRLIIPSSLAYGCAGQGNIGSNEVLYFDINLIDVQ
ncbi:MAG: FKBP-type peptidyl-prolyl cis-trans isomerase FkpA precursor [Chitinophagaceae bacterium]|nr:FKBP-type peptidyl-prolyl cis-trans isomerase FkpA precursor [Chitinophagaceae bacterium]